MKLVHSLGLGVVGFLGGLAISMSGDLLAKTVSIAGASALSASFITYLVVDSRAQREINASEKKAKAAGENLHKVIGQLRSSKEQFELANSQLITLKNELREARNTINSLGHSKLEHTKVIDHLQVKLNESVTQNELDNQHIDNLEAEIQQWENNFYVRVDELANSKVQQIRNEELERIFKECDEITLESMGNGTKKR